ncbi:hypothetical protein ACFL1B_06055 [Nanoarchaeota archaeon]
MKGQWLTLKKLIMFAITAAIFVAVLAFIVPLITDRVDDDTCKTSVAATSRLSILGQTMTSLKCKRESIQISSEDIQDGKALDKIAKRMQKCWENMGTGSDQQFQTNFLMQAKPCLVCAEIRFDSDVQATTLDGLEERLKQDDEGIVIWEYIYGQAAEVSPVVNYEGGEWVPAELTTYKEHYMIYMVNKKGVLWTELSGDAGDDVDTFIAIISGEDLSRECHYFYN